MNRYPHIPTFFERNTTFLDFNDEESVNESKIDENTPKKQKQDTAVTRA